MDKTISFYLLRVIDTAIGIGFEEKLNLAFFATVDDEAVVAGFDQRVMRLKVLHHAVASIPGASRGRYYWFAIVQSYAVVVGENIQACPVITQP